MKEIKIVVNGKSYDVKVGDISSSPVEVMVDGKSYQVEYEAASTAPVRRVVPAAPAPVLVAPVAVASAPTPVAAQTGGSGVRAPMPGTIVKVDVKAGDKVTRGQQLVSLEAMKMKNSIKSPADAVIKEVFVADGQKVQYNDMIVSFE
jgi:glutaconyl-CoA/methylmalonyl-CoA decarboxylase subunit gamma